MDFSSVLRDLLEKPLLLGLLIMFLVPPSPACTKSDNAKAAYERKDFAALIRMANAGDPVAQDFAMAVSAYPKAADLEPAPAKRNSSWLQKIEGNTRFMPLAR